MCICVKIYLWYTTRDSFFVYYDPQKQNCNFPIFKGGYWTMFLINNKYEGETYDIVVKDSFDPNWNGKVLTYTTPNYTGNSSSDGFISTGDEYTVVEISDIDYHWARIIPKGEEDDPNANQRWIYIEEKNTNIQPLTDLDKVRMQTSFLFLSLYNKDPYSERQRDYDVYSENELLEQYRNTIDGNSVTNTNGVLISSEKALLPTNFENDGSVDELYTHFIKLSMKAYGAPPQWTPYVDPRIASFDSNMQYRNVGFRLDTGFYYQISNTGNSIDIGRRYLDTIISNPTIISMCPGVIQNNSLLQKAAADWAVADGSEAALGSVVQASKSGQLAIFEQALYDTTDGTKGYFNYVDTLFQIAVTMMARDKSVGDPENFTELPARVFPGTQHQYKDFQWKYYDDPYVNNLAGYWKEDVTEYTYINFYGTGQNSVREEFSTDVRSSSIEDLINTTISSQLKDLTFLTAGTVGGEVQDDVLKWVSELGDKIGGIGAIFSNAAELFRGGHLIFPKVIDDCTYGKSMTFSCRFVATSGDQEDRLLNVISPYVHLLPFVIPRQAKGLLDMYTIPFLTRAFARGLFSCNMGVVTNFQVTKGGSDDSAWTEEGQPTEIAVSFDITPLYTKLMLSEYSSSTTYFLRNYGLMEYMGALCGVDMRMSQFELKVQLAATLWTSAMTNMVPNWLDGLLRDNVITRAFKQMGAMF